MQPQATQTQPDAVENQTQLSTSLPRSTLISRNVTVAGHRTSVRLEPEMWNSIVEINRRERVTLHDLCTRIAMLKDASTSLTAAIRVFIVNYFRNAATEEGHSKAGHGSMLIHHETRPINLAQAVSAQAHNLQTLERIGGSGGNNMLIGTAIKPKLRGW